MNSCGAHLQYNDLATFVSVTSGAYGNNKTVDEQVLVPVIFLQTTGFERNGFQDSFVADAICYPDPTNAFVVEHANRLEGMFIIMQLYGSTPEESWYKIEEVSVNRDHLLTNTIDNVELLLKKTRPVAGIS